MIDDGITDESVKVEIPIYNDGWMDNGVKTQERLLTVLADFILKRGWRLKLAKKEPIEQSLFIHSFNELGAIQSYLEKSPHPFGGPDILKLYIAAITHDCETRFMKKWNRILLCNQYY